MYLTEDYTGAASGIEFGKKGDKVDVIDTRDDMILVQGARGEIFWIKRSKLSETPIKPDIAVHVKTVKRRK